MKSYRLILTIGSLFCLVVLIVKGLKQGTSMSGAEQDVAQAEHSIAPATPVSPKQNMANGRSIPMPAASSETAQILTLLASDNPLDHSKVYRNLLPAFTRRNPLAAAAFAQSPEAAQWRNDLMVTVAQVWTDVNVDDAENWATQLTGVTERSMVLGYVCFEEANNNPTRAVQILDNSALNDVRREIIIENLAQQWANQDLQPLYDQLDKLPPGDERDGLFKRVALAQSQADAPLAAQMIAEKIATGPVQTEAVMYVLRQWAKQDMAAAVDWANHLGPGELHDKARVVLSNNLYGAFQSP